MSSSLSVTITYYDIFVPPSPLSQLSTCSAPRSTTAARIPTYPASRSCRRSIRANSNKSIFILIICIVGCSILLLSLVSLLKRIAPVTCAPRCAGPSISSSSLLPSTSHCSRARYPKSSYPQHCPSRYPS